MKWTVQAQAAAVRSAAERQPDRLSLRAVIEGRFGSGLVLTGAPGRPEVLGLAAVDSHGDAAALALYGGDVGQLRDALTAWLDEWEDAVRPPRGLRPDLLILDDPWTQQGPVPEPPL